MKNHRMYKRWLGMITRCDPDNKDKYAYRNYAGRGISVCDEWKDFQTFIDWVEKNGFKEGLSIDRINNDGNYEPDNCRFADSLTQASNRRKPADISKIPPVYNRLGYACRKKRRLLEISQTKLANTVGINQASITNFENGRNGLSSKTLDKILNALSIDVS